jgi:hypothetical protein
MGMLTQVIIDSIDVSSYLVSWKTEDELFAAITGAEIKLVQNVTDVVTPAVGHTITIKRGFTTSTDEFVFDGFIDEVEKDGGKFYNVFCKDKLWDLVRRSITKSFDENIDTEAGEVSDIFLTLINTYGGGVLTADSNSVQDASTLGIPTLSKFVCNGEDVFERCQFLADLIDWQFYFKASDGKVYFEPKGFLGSYGTLTVGTELYKNLLWSYDSSQLANKITVKGAKQEVETTESGQIGVTSGYTTAQFPTLFTPVSTKVFVENANPPTVLKTGGKAESTETYDYEVDGQNKLILFNNSQYTPGGSDRVECRYSYNIPAPVTGTNPGSITAYGQFEKVWRFDDLKTISDAENKFHKLMLKYSTPFINTDDAILGTLIDLKSGQKVTVVDIVNAENREVLIQSVQKSYPYKGDKLSLGDKSWRLAEWQVDVIDKLRELEKQLEGDTNILNHVFSPTRDIKPRRRYLKLQKEVLADPLSLVWDHATQGQWNDGGADLEEWGGTAFGSTSFVKILQGDMTYEEYCYDTDFHDAVNSTATFSTGNQDIAFTDGQIWYSSAIDIGTTLSYITVTLGTVVGTLVIEISSDNKATWQTVTEGTRTAVTTSDATGTYIRITSTGVSTIDLTQDSYGQNTEPVVKVTMEE